MRIRVLDPTRSCASEAEDKSMIIVPWSVENHKKVQSMQQATGLYIFRASAIVCAMLLASLPTYLIAQALPPTPPDILVLDGHGVNLTDGTAQFQLKEGSVGGQDGEIDYTDYWANSRDSSWGSWLLRYQDDINLNTYVVLSIRGKSIRFVKYLFGTSYQIVRGEYGSLSESADGRTFTYIDRQGSTMIFSIPTSTPTTGFCLDNSSTSSTQCTLYLTRFIKPNGVIFSNSWAVSGTYIRLESVENNLGYRETISYSYNGPDVSGNAFLWKSPARIDFFNLATGTAPIETIFHSTSNLSETITTAGGKIWHFQLGNGITAIRRPGAAIDSPTYTYGPTQLVTSATDNGQTTTYQYSESGGTATMKVTDANNGISVLTMILNKSKAGKSAFPSQSVDPLGRTTTYKSNGYYWVTELSRPEGDKDIFSYDGRGNIVSKTSRAKPSQSAADIVTTATYPSTCVNIFTCNHPISTVDAMQNTSDYTYSPLHGGVVTVTGPAVNGIHPQTRYTYSQHYAWIMDGSGGYVRASSPVWLRDQQSSCRSTAASGAGCAGGTSDEVQTHYDYGPDSGPNNLLLRGIVVTADAVSLRTCFGYDAQGNKISETSPRAGLTTCQ